jgi:hypothetical protein
MQNACSIGWRMLMSDLRVLRDLVAAPKPATLGREVAAAANPSENLPSKPIEDTVVPPSAQAKIALWAEASRKDPLVLRLAETARKMRTEYEATVRDLRDPLADWQIRAVRDKSNPNTVGYELSRKSGAPGRVLVTPGPNGARDATFVISQTSPTLFRALGFALGALQNGRLAKI